MPDLPRHRLVFLGPVTLEGNKPGELWATEQATLGAADAEGLRRLASPFGKGRRSSTVGAVYEGGAEVDEAGRVTRISRDMTYRTMLDTDAVVALALRAKGLQAQQDAEKAEAKARREGPANDLLDQLARIVAAGSINDQEHIIRGFSVEVRKRALQLWREGRGRR